MTHTHEDRVAERPAHMCSAYGCPLMGTMTASTSGADDWACSLHANKGAGQMQAVTVAINRHRWLATAITDVRSFVPGRAGKAELLERIRHDFTANKRMDLYWAGGTETVRQWVNRLEPELDRIVLAELELPPKQETLPTDTWQSAGKAMPLWA
jgi:hypothetical protein